ncbi:MAG: FAD-dependent monooxygenase [Carbonactinosporaceae bacterium]
MAAEATAGPWDVLVVGAGPTGLALAAQLHAHGCAVLVVDQSIDRVGESRALGVQPRTLEVLRPFRVVDELVRRGNPAVQLRIHAGSRVARTKLFDIGLDDTEFPFLLFLSQAETEAVLGEHLAGGGVRVDRGVRLEDIATSATGCIATLRSLADDTVHRVPATFVVGCDGAHSTVRGLAAIPFLGGGYPQTFLLADLEVDGLEPGTVHAFLTGDGPLLLFPLGHPAPWRIITMRPDRERGHRSAGAPTAAATRVSLDELQTLADKASGGSLRLHAPVWATAFRLHHRHAATYRSGRVFLAGDAAHIHSPAGAQGMNTGIQDAINLGWKLALRCRGEAPETLLDSYDAERRPVGEFVLRFTDRAFKAATSNRPVARLARSHLVPRVLPLVLNFRVGRALAFRTVSQLGITYRSGAAIEPGARRRPVRGPRAGDRLPDAEVLVDGTPSRLHEAICSPGFHLLLAGPPEEWGDADVAAMATRYEGLLTIHRLSPVARPGVLHDFSGAAHRRLHVRHGTAFVVRPDGHIGHRGDGTELDGALRYLSRMLPEQT